MWKIGAVQEVKLGVETRNKDAELEDDDEDKETEFGAPLEVMAVEEIKGLRSMGLCEITLDSGAEESVWPRGWLEEETVTERGWRGRGSSRRMATR